MAQVGHGEMDEETKTRLEKIVATTQLMLDLIKGVVNVCLSFKLDVHRHPQLKEI